MKNFFVPFLFLLIVSVASATTYTNNSSHAITIASTDVNPPTMITIAAGDTSDFVGTIASWSFTDVYGLHTITGTPMFTTFTDAMLASTYTPPTQTGITSARAQQGFYVLTRDFPPSIASYFSGTNIYVFWDTFGNCNIYANSTATSLFLISHPQYQIRTPTSILVTDTFGTQNYWTGTPLNANTGIGASVATVISGTYTVGTQTYNKRFNFGGSGWATAGSNTVSPNAALNYFLGVTTFFSSDTYYHSSTVMLLNSTGTGFNTPPSYLNPYITMHLSFEAWNNLNDTLQIKSGNSVIAWRKTGDTDWTTGPVLGFVAAGRFAKFALDVQVVTPATETLADGALKLTGTVLSGTAQIALGVVGFLCTPTTAGDSEIQQGLWGPNSQLPLPTIPTVIVPSAMSAVQIPSVHWSTADVTEGADITTYQGVPVRFVAGYDKVMQHRVMHVSLTNVSPTELDYIISYSGRAMTAPMTIGKTDTLTGHYNTENSSWTLDGIPYTEGGTFWIQAYDKPNSTFKTGIMVISTQHLTLLQSEPADPVFVGVIYRIGVDDPQAYTDSGLIDPTVKPSLDPGGNTANQPGGSVNIAQNPGILPTPVPAPSFPTIPKPAPGPGSTVLPGTTTNNTTNNTSTVSVPDIAAGVKLGHEQLTAEAPVQNAEQQKAGADAITAHVGSASTAANTAEANNPGSSSTPLVPSTNADPSDQVFPELVLRLEMYQKTWVIDADPTHFEEYVPILALVGWFKTGVMCIGLFIMTTFMMNRLDDLLAAVGGATQILLPKFSFSVFGWSDGGLASWLVSKGLVISILAAFFGGLWTFMHNLMPDYLATGIQHSKEASSSGWLTFAHNFLYPTHTVLLTVMKFAYFIFPMNFIISCLTWCVGVWAACYAKKAGWIVFSKNSAG